LHAPDKIEENPAQIEFKIPELIVEYWPQKILFCDPDNIDDKHPVLDMLLLLPDPTKE